MKIKTTIDVDVSNIIDLICTGAEGGMMSWCDTMDSELSDDADLSEIPKGMRDFPRYFAPFAGGSIVFEAENPANPHKTITVHVDQPRIEKALQLMATKYPGHFGDFTNENEDAITGDVFLQLAVYGEVIFG